MQLSRIIRWQRVANYVAIMGAVGTVYVFATWQIEENNMGSNRAWKQYIFKSLEYAKQRHEEQTKERNNNDKPYQKKE